MCLFPIGAVKWKYYDDIGQLMYGFKLTKNPDFLIKNNLSHDKRNFDFEKLSVPCNKCIECQMQNANEFALRCILEAKSYDKNCMLTLTYKNNPISLNKRDLQLFFKRLRKRIGQVRYFACGEYGSKGMRPHYHVILFGYSPPDLLPFFERNGNVIYKSQQIEEIWKNGFISVGELTFDSAKYTAKYLQKLNACPDSCLSPFLMMSLKPGIGYNYFIQNYDDIIKNEGIYYHGKKYKIPKYFMKKFNLDLVLYGKGILDDIKQHNLLRMSCYDVNLEEKRKKFINKFGKII